MIATQSNQEHIMASTRPTPPTLQPLTGPRYWTTTWYDESGKRRMKRLGRDGKISRRHAQARYDEWYSSEWKAKDHVRNPQGGSAGFTVNSLADLCEKHAEQIYRKNGKLTSFIWQVRSALSKLRDAYGNTIAGEITGPHIAELRDSMIWAEVEPGSEPRPLRRSTVNDRLQIIKRCFSWAHTEKGLVSQMVAWSVSQVEPLKAFRSKAEEPQKVLPIADEIIEATANSASRVISEMIWLCRYTGMRPGEACIIRAMDIEAGGDVWIYRPHSHKTQHHGKSREICLGSRAQAIVSRNFVADTSSYLFTPAKAIADFCAAKGQRMPTVHGQLYTVRSFRQAIHRACARAFDDDTAWNPNQLRHKWATEVRKAFDLESAAIGLGHSDLRTAEIYAERDREKAMEVARKVG